MWSWSKSKFFLGAKRAKEIYSFVSSFRIQLFPHPFDFIENAPTRFSDWLDTDPPADFR